jgi:Uncharacterized MobA-related protein
MRDLLDIRKFIFEASPQDQLVLCTLIKKTGSSYRQVGAKKLVSLSGESRGLLSGGCLEGAIERAARENWDRMPFTESFSTLSEEDRLMGYQTGCQGIIEILFEQVPARTENILGWKSQIDKMIPYNPIRLIVLGCGADAPPFAGLAQELGWDLRFIDYRSDLAKPDNFSYGRVELIPLTDIPAHIPEGRNVAVVLMTHNYEADLEILRGLRNHHLGYLGCLGPHARYEKLKEDLQNFHEVSLSKDIQRVVSAPAGIFSHSSSPSEISLSIVAQIQEQLVERHNVNTWTLLLVAGESKRFGGVKALAEWQGETFLSKALKTAAEFSGCRRTMVVTGGHAPLLQTYLGAVSSVHNDSWMNGMGTSISCGLRAIMMKDPKVENVLILPVDQPLIENSHLQKLLKASACSDRCAMTSHADIAGPPAIIPKKYFPLALTLEGDSGLKSILKNSDMISVEGPSALLDVDHHSDFADLHNYIESGL